NLKEVGSPLLAFAIGAAGLTLLLVAAGWGAQAKGAPPAPLEADELRLRLDKLSEDAGVRVQQAYVLSAARWRLANVFAAAGQSVHVTPALLQELTGREVDAVLALELVFLWRRRVRNFLVFIAYFLVMFLPVFALITLGSLLGLEIGRWLPLLGIFSLLLVPVHQFRLRRFGPSLDVDAVHRTGDVEALLTALAKLGRLRLLPLTSWRWHRRPDDDPLPWGRLDPLAQRFDIPPDRLEEIVAGPGTGVGVYASLTPSVTASAEQRGLPPENRADVLSPSRKSRSIF